jgi:hypothetical protein
VSIPIWKPLVAGAAVAAIHLGITAYLFAQTAPTRALQAIADIIGFPLYYVDRLAYRGVNPRIFGFDWAPFLVIGNSLLWGAAFALVSVWWVRRLHRQSGPPSS